MYLTTVNLFVCAHRMSTTKLGRQPPARHLWSVCSGVRELLRGRRQLIKTHQICREEMRDAETERKITELQNNRSVSTIKESACPPSQMNAIIFKYCQIYSDLLVNIYSSKPW